MSQPAVSIETSEQVICAVVHHSTMDDVACHELQREVLSAAEKQPQLPMLVDLSEVKFVPSLGLGTLVMLNRKLKDKGQRFALVGVHADVRAILALTRLDKLFEMHADRAAALDERHEIT
jgi:anti-sigma B factor antagonist